MREDRLSRLGPLCGVLFVVLELGGVAVGAAGGRAMVALDDPAWKMMNAFADPVGTAVWVGAYMELAALVAYGVFAVWLFGSRRGPAAVGGLLTAGLFIAVTLVSLVIGDVLEYQAGHGLGAPATTALFDLQVGLFTTTWGIGGVVLLLAPVGGWLRKSAVAIAALSIAGMAVPKSSIGQFSSVLFLLWILAAGIVLARRERTANVPAAARA